MKHTYWYLALLGSSLAIGGAGDIALGTHACSWLCIILGFVMVLIAVTAPVLMKTPEPQSKPDWRTR